MVLKRTIVVIPAGHVGVVSLFGKVSDTPLEAGLRLINPLANVIKMSIRTEELTETASVPSKEGLTIDLDATLLFRLDPRKAPQVYKTIGVGYTDVVVIPQFRAVIRGVTAEYEAKALYTSERELLASKMLDTLRPLLEGRGIDVEKILLRSITLPNKVKAAIEEKLEAEQQAEKMKFVLDRERQEAERKKIEAEGIAAFQDIVSKGLSENFLKWKGIEVTKELAASQNAKVVVIGAGKDGLPLILGGSE
jgi:regulator of protease activity HflC (stomatin/prohibitin superfamily)